MSSINGIPITTDSIIKCYEKYYPDSYNLIAKDRLFHYLHLWAIRVSTYDTGLPDDYMGGLRINNLGFNEIAFSAGSVDPSPRWLIESYSSTAQKLGGTAWMVEGQYSYRYNGNKHGSFAPYPSFCPIKPTKVYRWLPTTEEKNMISSGKLPAASLFDKALKEGKVKTSTSPDTCIHRSWNKRFWGDSAGCQIYADLNALTKVGVFANEHISKKYQNIFTYTLFSLQQFMSANGGAAPTDKSSAIDYILRMGKYGGSKSILESFEEGFIMAWVKGIGSNQFSFDYKGKKYTTQGGGYTVY